jgi:hypothetical protein
MCKLSFCSRLLAPNIRQREFLKEGAVSVSQQVYKWTDYMFTNWLSKMFNIFAEPDNSDINFFKRRGSSPNLQEFFLKFEFNKNIKYQISSKFLAMLEF